MSRSPDKIDVVVEKRRFGDGTEKLWVVVRNRDGGNELVPSFEDLHRITLAIVWCEIQKYKGQVVDPSEMVRRFHNRSVDASRYLCAESNEWPLDPNLEDRVWRQLASEFKIPLREKTQTVKPTPAKETQEDCQPGCTCELCAEWPIRRAAP